MAVLCQVQPRLSWENNNLLKNKTHPFNKTQLLWSMNLFLKDVESVRRSGYIKIEWMM